MPEKNCNLAVISQVSIYLVIESRLLAGNALLVLFFRVRRLRRLQTAAGRQVEEDSLLQGVRVRLPLDRVGRVLHFFHLQRVHRFFLTDSVTGRNRVTRPVQPRRNAYKNAGEEEEGGSGAQARTWGFSMVRHQQSRTEESEFSGTTIDGREITRRARIRGVITENKQTRKQSEKARELRGISRIKTRCSRRKNRCATEETSVQKN